MTPRTRKPVTVEHLGPAPVTPGPAAHKAGPGAGTVMAPPDGARETSPQRDHGRVVAGTALPAAGAASSLRAAPGRERAAQTPAVGAGISPAPSAGTTALKGAEWRAAVAAAQGKGRRRTPRATPAVPAGPPADGARVTASAHCISGCDWKATGGAADVDKAAEAHTAKPPRHATATVMAVAA